MSEQTRSDERPIEDRIAQAIGDPGSYLPRGVGYGDELETVTHWSTRAVMTLVEPLRAQVADLQAQLAETRAELPWHIEASEGTRCLKCGEPWTCQGYIDDINKPDPAEQLEAVREALAFDDYGTVEKSRVRAALAPVPPQPETTKHRPIGVPNEQHEMACSCGRGWPHGPVSPETTTEEN